MASDELVRPSRDGDQFHYHWAARHCIALIPGSGDLVAVSIEGASTSEDVASAVSGDELIDVGLYYGSEMLKSARLVHYVQLKHSTRHVQKPWTASGLDKTIRGFSKRYVDLLRSIPAEALKQTVRFSFTTNRPIDQKVLEALEDLANKRRPRHPSIERTLLQYTELSGSVPEDFFQVFSAEGSQPDLWTQRNLLAQDLSIYLAEADSDTPVQLKELVARKATSEFAGNSVIRRHDVLRALKVSELDLLPAPCLVIAPPDMLPRDQEANIRGALSVAKHPIVLHADGGVGKSVLAFRLAKSVPIGSVAVLYDCFGDGLYRNTLHFRHRHRDALPQIANELAAQGLCHPLIPATNADAKHFMRAFSGRLGQALRLLQARQPEASLCIIIDAADNADMAAEEHGDTAFIRDLIRTPFPEGIKLVFTCRTHRRWRLDPPPEAVQFELRPFSQAETTSHLRRFYPHATNAEAAEFAFLSSCNPRVQALALSRKRSICKMLKELGPAPSTVERAIGGLLQNAVDKLKDRVGHVESAQIDLICQALAVLRPLVPIWVLAQISDTSESAIRSFAFDLGGPLLVKGSSLHFLDEPAETWFREQFKPEPETLAIFLQRIRPLAARSSYVASTLPQLLLSAGLMDELVSLTLSDDGLPTSNPLERRDVEIQRLTFALKACLQRRQYAAAAKLALKAGGEAAGEARQTRLIQDNTDLAATLLSTDRIDELVSRRTFGGNWMGAHHAYDAGLLSGRSEFLPEARSRLRMALDWLYARARQPVEQRENEQVDDSDRAEIAMAQLLASGPEEAAKFLSGWKPRHIVLPTSKRLARRLLDLGRHEQLDALAKHGAKDPWLILGLVSEASHLGYNLPAEPVARLMHTLARRRVKFNEVTQWGNSRWDVLDAVTAAILLALRVLPRKDAIWAEILRRYLPESPPSDLTDSFGTDLSPLLRGYALEASLRSEVLTLLAIAPPAVRKDLESKGVYSGNTDKVAFERATGGVLPWFVLGAEIACGRTPSDLNKAIGDALEVTANAALQDYQKMFNVEQVAALEWIRILREAAATNDSSVDTLRIWLTSKQNFLWPDTLTSMCRIAARTQRLSNLALDLAVAAFESLEQSREDAEARSDSYQRLARAVFPVSRSEAAAYFNRAVEISSRIGDENLYRWTALLSLAEASAEDNHPRPKSAYRLARVAELIYEYVARDKDFDWHRTVEALLGLCSPSALAILSRWRDRDFGYSQRLLRIAVYSLVRAERLPALAPIALSGLNAEWDRFEDVKRAIEAEADPVRRRLILQVGYRYIRVNPHSENTWDGLSELGRTYGVDLPDIDRLLAVAQASATAAPKTEPVYAPNRPIKRRVPDWDRLFAGVDLANPEAVRQAYAELRTFDPPYQLEEFYKQGFRRSGTGMMAEFVKAIAAWPDLDIIELRYLLDAVPESGARLLSLRRALRDVTLAACRNNPEYASRHGRVSIFPYERLVGGSIIKDKEVVDALLEGFTAKAATLNADELFLLLDPLASCLTPKEADNVLNFGVDLLENVLCPEDGDGPWHESLTPPPACDEALAGYLWVSLGSPIAAKRWEAAHAVRACVELGWMELLTALAARASANSAKPFTDQGLVFYEWHARQWLLIGLARGAIDQPAAVKPFISLLTASVTEEHVLLRHFAAASLKSLHLAGIVSTEVIVGLDAVNVSSLPHTVYLGLRSDAQATDDADNLAATEHEKYNFGIDIGPYWFKPLGRAFGVNENSIKLRARQVLRERMRVQSIHARDDARYKRKILRGHDTSHSHGIVPRVDDLRTYYSYHAMMIVAARLLKTHPVGKSEGDPKDDFEEWLEGRQLTRADGRWIADRRDPRLTEPPPKPQGYSDKTWRWSVTAEYLDQQLLTDDGLQVLWGYWSNGDDNAQETISVRSTLVDRVGAAALLAAIQTAPDTERIYFPSENEIDGPETGFFRLLGWVVSRNEITGIDEYDPWGEKLEYPGPGPNPSVVDTLGLTLTADGRRWVTASGSILRSETWTQAGGLGRDQEIVSGTRLSVSSSFLNELLKAYPKDYLVLSVSVRRRPSRYNSGGDEFDAYSWPYVRYYLIGEDGIARSLKSRD